MSPAKISKKKILVVEDDQPVLEVVNEALIQAGFETAVATSAHEAFAKIGEFQPDLVLSDHDMPHMTGLDMLSQLRKNENYVSVIFISGRSDLRTVCEALEIGADDYIRKPFRFEELIARIRNCLRTKEVHVQLRRANEKLQEMVDRDYLTGLYNMRTMYERIDFELARARRYSRQVAAVMIDMDHFKTVNDQNDHLFGSFVLGEMGKILAQNVRGTDLAARYGGDEFLVILTEVDRDGAKVFCERLRARIESHVFASERSQIRLTISLGYALTGGENSIDARTLVRSADHALYQAKEQGRNRWVEFSSTSAKP
ncbi:MAG: diguanylate cyclase [Bdellovibrionales bacterium]|nr:diguanylate cyclase [Bdellovibrionales bacterium]